MLTAAATAEGLRRTATRITGRVHSLPILALHAHSACNCRCVMCDIWKANAEKREISVEILERNVAAIKRLRVQRVMLTGGEPLLHANLWAFCQRLRAEGVRLTLVTTGLLLESCASHVARLIDEVVISVDGPPDTHDAIRRVRGGFDRLARGVQALRDEVPRPKLTARCVVQKANYTRLADTIHSVQAVGFDHLSFLAADISSTAFNRPDGWTPDRQAEIALSPEDVRELAGDIADIERAHAEALRIGFVQGGAPSLWRIFHYYAALAGLRELPLVRCNAPWVSAVLEPGGAVRPCFFHPPYRATESGELDDIINSPGAIAFRRQLDVNRDETCRRCVCTLSLPLMRDA